MRITEADTSSYMKASIDRGSSMRRREMCRQVGEAVLPPVRSEVQFPGTVCQPLEELDRSHYPAAPLRQQVSEVSFCCGNLTQLLRHRQSYLSSPSFSFFFSRIASCQSFTCTREGVKCVSKPVCLGAGPGRGEAGLHRICRPLCSHSTVRWFFLAEHLGLVLLYRGLCRLPVRSRSLGGTCEIFDPV